MMLSHMNEEIKSSENGLMKKDYSSTIFPANVCRALISNANCFFAIRPDRAKFEEKEDEFADSRNYYFNSCIPGVGLFIKIFIGWIVEFLTNAVFSDRLSTFVCQILCAWLDSPQLRTQAKLKLVLDRIFASVIEIELFEQKETIELDQQWLSNDSFQLRNFSRIFLNLLRTWAGLFACSTLDDQKTSIISALRWEFPAENFVITGSSYFLPV
ncbi:unnamed protein product [Onchocerca flexuosa]|uniref:RICTOR_N domain-containing protein n=1 Tax=Onchocerca flexuosa TaxID=387005 RepID=A0A183HBA2_9BILA|nr:unnamed protein product [Onchocerca flexuosa]